eukprot:jgi/Mesvir1/17199/Mv07618-RA.1
MENEAALIASQLPEPAVDGGNEAAAPNGQDDSLSQAAKLDSSRSEEESPAALLQDDGGNEAVTLKPASSADASEAARVQGNASARRNSQDAYPAEGAATTPEPVKGNESARSGTTPEPVTGNESARSGTTPEPVTGNESARSGTTPEPVTGNEPSRSGTTPEPVTGNESARSGTTPEPVTGNESARSGTTPEPVTGNESARSAKTPEPVPGNESALSTSIPEPLEGSEYARSNPGQESARRTSHDDSQHAEPSAPLPSNGADSAQSTSNPGNESARTSLQGTPEERADATGAPLEAKLSPRSETHAGPSSSLAADADPATPGQPASEPGKAGGESARSTAQAGDSTAQEAMPSDPDGSSAAASVSADGGGVGPADPAASADAAPGMEPAGDSRPGDGMPADGTPSDATPPATKDAAPSGRGSVYIPPLELDLAKADDGSPLGGGAGGGQNYNGEDGDDMETQFSVMHRPLSDASTARFTSKPSEVEGMALYLGIGPDELYLYGIAAEACLAPVLPPWEEVQDDAGNPVFHNVATGRWSKRHPLDYMFLRLVQRTRAQGPPEGKERVWMKFASGVGGVGDGGGDSNNSAGGDDDAASSTTGGTSTWRAPSYFYYNFKEGTILKGSVPEADEMIPSVPPGDVPKYGSVELGGDGLFSQSGFNSAFDLDAKQRFTRPAWVDDPEAIASVKELRFKSWWSSDGKRAFATLVFNMETQTFDVREYIIY